MKGIKMCVAHGGVFLQTQPKKPPQGRLDSFSSLNYFRQFREMKEELLPLVAELIGAEVTD